MSNAARSIYIYGVYLVILGLACHAPHDLVKWKCESPADSPGLPARHV
jgi:hypothetical protein